MNKERGLIFIVGPGGAGKSTSGRILADKLNYEFVDVDQAFCERIALIPDYVHQHGYKAYCEANSLLVDGLITQYPQKTVFPMPSGFLVHEDSPELVIKHKSLLAQTGVSILLLPSLSLEESVQILVQRQLMRGFPDIKEEKERITAAKRYPKYREYGDIKIFSVQPPEEIASLVFRELHKLGL